MIAAIASKREEVLYLQHAQVPAAGQPRPVAVGEKSLQNTSPSRSSKSCNPQILVALGRTRPTSCAHRDVDRQAARHMARLSRRAAAGDVSPGVPASARRA